MSILDRHSDDTDTDFDPSYDLPPDARELAEMDTWRHADRYHPTTHPTGEQ